MRKLNSAQIKRATYQKYTFWVLPAVIAAGWIYPAAGFLLFLCMLGAVGFALYKGRSWCNWMCPRGAFYDLLLGKISRNVQIPGFFRKKSVRIFMVLLIMSVIGIQFYQVWGNLNSMGLVLIRLLTITTAAGIIFGTLFHPRTWCHICPMGTIANWLSKGKKPLYISDNCVSCKLCTKVCPMQLKPYDYKGFAVMGDNDCLKCSSCVEACPKKALSFSKVVQSNFQESRKHSYPPEIMR
ncbi:4Fe-4S ferredoxin iron-sulfur binding domain protein [Desulfofarcimen acetoxidans DSM 771]|jgi:polyferredoxin|uniref:4Fe-4S ferredoxin iron-sulfur binding domain protein n=1 Tax=Desulfofarcimen acetoxidans (strain ATCC 49208 / DSM 771 / KCTC 5769 / VKM B-1644 / 5575) TaxID=485916 RepID=C8VZX8_DESAS|nr:4Fe-4S binding protein [Desulfofarcimen acetoxidans]ACV63106.1 4Fe-4S ferredoxin iron-sulfur binding domain protein [Desulfofarcimen acetoxidans DSM 771]